ncbi:ATP-grasp domain-containing protein [Glutamicibacter bergerei]|uniref:ATP-grasp domain-containing protein n=1 Tax=Glutamicibacter bergerei TaxID=256702 RepID=A0ABV9MH27_9MICC
MTSIVEWPSNFSSKVVKSNLGGSGVSTVSIALEAWRRGLKVEIGPVGLRYFNISDGKRKVQFDAARPVSETDSVAVKNLARKNTAASFLRSAGVATPAGRIVDNHRELEEASDSVGYPVVLKPDTGSMGRGVFTNLRTALEAKTAFDEIRRLYPRKKVLLEKFIQGNDYRVLVVGTEVVGAVRRIPANIIGNGTNTVRELIDSKNRDRMKNPFLASGKLKIDLEVQQCLSEQLLTLDSIPAMKQKVTLRKVANASAGGDVQDVTDQLPNTIVSAAKNVMKAYNGIQIAGIDFIIDDLEKDEPFFAVIEVNTRPHIGVNMYPSIGRGRDVPNKIINYFFPNSIRYPQGKYSSIKFDEQSILNFLREGVAESVQLPWIPKHGFPCRRRVIFDFGEFTDIPRFHERVLKKAARDNGISGSIKRMKTGQIQLIMGAENRLVTDKFIAQIQDRYPVSVARDAMWTGPITIGFKIDQ